jgi:hypothetical protein
MNTRTLTHSHTPLLSDTVARVPGAWCGPEARAALLWAGEALPGVLARSLLLECRLHPRPGAVDLCACISPPLRPACCDGPEEAARLPWWGEVQALCRAWEEQPAALRNLWIEIDLRDAAVGRGTPPVPNFLARIPPTTSPGEVVGWMERMHGAPLSARRTQALQRIADRFAGEGWLAGAGIMRQRTGRPGQLFVKEVAPARLRGLLREAGWPGTRRQVETWERLMREIGSGLKSRPGISLHHTLAVGEAGGELHSAFRVETRVAAPSLRERTAAWTSVLGALARRGLAPFTAPADLRQWTGGRWVVVPGRAAPAVQVRSLSHLKTTTASTGEIEVKAYLSAVVRPSTPLNRS